MKRLLISCAALVAMVYFTTSVTSGMYGRATAENQANLRKTIQSMCAHCYAVEGRYPMSLGYLEEHYGLDIDADRYIVHFYPVSSNLMPDIAVLPNVGGADR